VREETAQQREKMPELLYARIDDDVSESGQYFVVDIRHEIAY